MSPLGAAAIRYRADIVHSGQHDQTLLQLIKAHFNELCFNLPKALFHCHTTELNDYAESRSFKFSESCPAGEEQFNRLLFAKDHKSGFAKVRWKRCLPPRNIDLDFDADWNSCMRFLVPLDPFLDIGPCDWKEKGMLREHYARRESLKPHVLSRM